MGFDDLLRRPGKWASVLGWATLAGLEFGLIGPFGSYASHLGTRIIYWTALFWIGSLLLWPCAVAGLVLGPRRGFPPFLSAVAVVLVACAPLAALGALGTWLFWPVRAASMQPLEWYWLTIIVALPAMGGLLWLELGRARLAAPWADFAPGGPREATAGQGAGQGTMSAPPPANPAIPTTIPDHLLDSALCLQMEDHHVRVHLHGRSLLHHAVMRDVVATMGEARGLQVHRSWWVARDAVRGWQREGRSVALLLVNGLRVPVARNRVAILREHGWLAGEEGPA